MDRCRYKTLLRNSAKLKSNSQYTNQNTSYLPLDIYTCYDYFQPPSFTMSGATKMTGPYGVFEYDGSPYTTQGMSHVGLGPSGATQNSVWNMSQSAVTLEYYFPYEKMSGYTGKFRSSVYKFDDQKNGFSYPPVHQKYFNSFPLTADLTCEAKTTATTFSVFFSISATSEGSSVPSGTHQQSWYWFGQDITRSAGAGGHLEPTWPGFYTAYTLTNLFNNVYISTGGTIGGNGTTGGTYEYTRVYTQAEKNGWIIPTNSTNVTNDGVTGNAGYWQDGECYMTGVTWNMAIGAGNNGPTGLLNLSGAPQLVSSSGGPYSGLYTGFATGNAYVYTACCTSKLVDRINNASLSTSRGENQPANSNTYLVKGSFVYSGDGTTEACYLTSGNTYDTLIDDPNKENFEGVKDTFYRNNLYYPEKDFSFIAVTDPPKPIIQYSSNILNIDSNEVSVTSASTNDIEFVVENLPVTSEGQSIFYLSQDPIGDVTLSVNGVVLENNIEFVQDKREIEIKVIVKGGSTIDIETTDTLVAAYVKGNGVEGLITEGATVPSTGVLTGATLPSSQNTLYNKFNYNSGTTTFEYYTNQPLNSQKQSDLGNLIVLVNGVRQKPNNDFYRSKSNNRLVIFNPNITLVANDTVNLFYLTNLQGIDNQSLGSSHKQITWTVSPTPQTNQGFFAVEVTNSADTKFVAASTYNTVGYIEGVNEYTTRIGPFNTLNQKYLYRVVNNRSYIGVSGSNITTTATSLTNKFDTDNPALLSY